MDFGWVYEAISKLAIVTIGLSAFAYAVLLSLRITRVVAPETVEDWFSKKDALNAAFWIYTIAATGFVILSVSWWIVGRTDLMVAFIACATTLAWWARNKHKQAEEESLRRTKAEQLEYDRTHNADSDDNWKPSVS